MVEPDERALLCMCHRHMTNVVWEGSNSTFGCYVVLWSGDFSPTLDLEPNRAFSSLEEDRHSDSLHKRILDYFSHSLCAAIRWKDRIFKKRLQSSFIS